MAEKRQRPYRLAFTSNQGIPVDPLEISAEELTSLVQTSDLTANPALALERTLEDETTAEGDVILLTHPFSLAEPDVGNAARRVRPGSRLFGLGIDDQGRAMLSEFRGGTALPLQRFHVHPETLSTLPVKPASVDLSWKGDVEAIGYPFRFGVEAETPRSPLQFAFDYAGERLLIAAANGMLFATDCATGDTEVVPRGVYKGRVLRQVEAALGVAGGLVVFGVVALIPVVFHYHWVSRTCKATRLIYIPLLRPEKAGNSHQGSMTDRLIWWCFSIATIMSTPSGWMETPRPMPMRAAQYRFWNAQALGS